MRRKSSYRHLNVCSKIIVILFLMHFISGCNHNPENVKVYDLRSSKKLSGESYLVTQGDSLYSIAWRYSVDFRTLAKMNGIYPPYTIYPGQHIWFSAKPPQGFVTKQLFVKNKNVIKNKTIKKPPHIKWSSKKTAWQWPVLGAVIEPFSLTGHINKGIDIRAKLGEAVRAAAAGEVVYAGDDLGGYGKLIIIKHNNSYLSAYAHNKELYMREGDSVKASQKIAEIGSTGTTEPKLHFEIRRNGKPVDPMGYLPKR